MKLNEVLVCTALLFGAGAAAAADPVTDAINAAYPPYRAVLFRTNGTSKTDAEQAMGQARTAWKALSTRFATSVPAPYDRDPGFGATLSKVTAVYAAAAAEIDAGKLREAHQTLEEARDLISDLRRRNGVIVYSDHINAYHSLMEHLIDEGAATVEGPAGSMQLMARAGALEYLATRLRSEAPAQTVADPAFKPALEAVERSVAALKQALLDQNPVKAKEALGGLKKPFSQLFMKFG